MRTYKQGNRAEKEGTEALAVLEAKTQRGRDQRLQSYLVVDDDDDEQTHYRLTHPLRPGFRHHVVTESQPFRSPGRRTQRTRLVLFYIIYFDITETKTTLKGTNRKTDKRLLDYEITHAHSHITHARD